MALPAASPLQVDKTPKLEVWASLRILVNTNDYKIDFSIQLYISPRHGHIANYQDQNKIIRNNSSYQIRKINIAKNLYIRSS